MLWQPANVMVALDDNRLLVLRSAGFDHIRIDRALSQPGDVTGLITLELARLALEHLNELAPNDLALGLWIADSGQLTQELLRRVDPNHFGVELSHKHVHDHVAFIKSKQAVVNEYAGQLLADGPVNQRRCHRGIDSARQSKDHLFLTHLRPDSGHSFTDVVPHDPVSAGSTNVQNETLQDSRTAFGMSHFRVELDAVEAPVFIRHTGDRATVGRRHELESVWQFDDLVAVAHPDLQHSVPHSRGVVLDTFKQLGVTMSAHICVAKFAPMATLNNATELVRHGLHSIADAQHRHTELEYAGWRLVGGVFVHTGMTARQDDAPEFAVSGIGTNPVIADVAGMYLAKNVRFANAPGNQLRDLGTKVKYEDLLMHF